MATSQSRRNQSSNSSEEAYAGPIPSSLPTSPDSPSAKRVLRYHGKTNSLADFSRQHGLTDEDYRCHGPTILTLPRFQVAGSPSERAREAWSSSLRSYVDQVLHEFGVNQVRDAELVLLASQESSATSHQTTASFIVVEAVRHVLHEPWFQAADKILRRCYQLGLEDLNIEIADIRGLIPRVSRTVSSEEPIVKDWHNIIHLVLKTLNPRRHWLTIDLVSRGKARRVSGSKHEDEFKPTLLIMIEEESNEDWVAAMHGLCELLDRKGYGNVAVEIIRGATRRFAVGDKPFQRHKNIWQTEAYMGASI